VRDAQKKMREAESRALAAAMEGLARDLLALSDRQESVSEDTGAGTTTDLAGTQGILHEETARVADRLFQLGRTTPFVTPELAAALGNALQSSQDATDGYEHGNRALGDKRGAETRTSLNGAVLQLLQAKESACNGGGSGGMKSLLQRLSALSDMQGQLNAESQQLMPGSGERLSISAEGQLSRMAAQQEMIRQGLDDLAREAQGSHDQMGQLGKVAEDMKAVESDLSASRLTAETLDRQHKILSRLLDAQHAAEKRDFERRRTAEAGREVESPSPGPVPASALTERERITIDLLRAHADPVPPEYRRLIDEYFRALNATDR